MGLISNIKNKLKEEVDTYRNKRAMEKDPKILKALVKEKQEEYKKQQDFESDKKKLQELKNKTGIRGQIASGLGAVKTHLAEVKKRNATAERYKLRNPNNSQFSTTGGVMNSSTNGRGMHSDLPGRKSALLGGVGSGKSPATSGITGKSSVFNTTGKSPVLGDNKKKKGGVFN